jgi:hypothetical protein
MPPLLGLLCCFGLNLFSVQIHSFRLYVSSATDSWAKELFPVRCDFGEKPEVLSFLPESQDFGTGMSQKGARQPWMAYRAPVRAVPGTLEQRA